MNDHWNFLYPEIQQNFAAKIRAKEAELAAGNGAAPAAPVPVIAQGAEHYMNLLRQQAQNMNVLMNGGEEGQDGDDGQDAPQEEGAS